MRFIEKPNLPENKVKLMAVSESAGESIKNLKRLEIITLPIKKNQTLPAGISSHADLHLLHLGENETVIPDFSESEQLFDCLKKYNFNVKRLNHRLESDYPGDVPVNAKIIGNFVICDKKTISKEVLVIFESSGKTIIDTNQGYSGCSVCVLNENAIITDDPSVYKSAQKFLNDVTFIEKNSIQLSGYNYGFIGGCCGKISKYEIAFNGELSFHSDCSKIADALQRNNIRPIELKKGPLEDIGGFIPLLEKIDSFLP